MVEGSDETEKLSKNWANKDRKDDVPNEKSINRGFSNRTLFPGDFGVKDVGDDSGDGGRDKGGKPK